MTFEEWLIAHEERVEKDLNVKAPLLISYINNIDIQPYEDVVLWQMSGIFDVAQNYTYEEQIEYLHSYIDMYRRDYEKQAESGSRSKGSIVSQLIGQG